MVKKAARDQNAPVSRIDKDLYAFTILPDCFWLTHFPVMTEAKSFGLLVVSKCHAGTV
jgi:hypothetical protein